MTNTSAKGDERHQALIRLDQMVVIQLKTSKNLTICEAAKGYEGGIFREQLFNKGYLPVIGYKKNRTVKISAAKVAEFFRCKQKRWGIERAFSWLKRTVRRLLMRWERLAGLCEAFSKLGLIYMWLGYLIG